MPFGHGSVQVEFSLRLFLTMACNLVICVWNAAFFNPLSSSLRWCTITKATAVKEQAAQGFPQKIPQPFNVMWLPLQDVCLIFLKSSHGATFASLGCGLEIIWLESNNHFTVIWFCFQSLLNYFWTTLLLQLVSLYILLTGNNAESWPEQARTDCTVEILAPLQSRK